MEPEEVKSLMEGSQTEDEWNANCTRVKELCDGYPSFWFKEIVQSGLAKRVSARWAGDAQIHIQIVTTK